MGKRLRHHVNPLKASYAPAHAATLPATGEVEVELGCADAQFLFQRAAVNPNRTYFGVEIRADLVDEVNQRAARLALPVRAVFAHVNLALPALFPDGRVARIHINFPDPWFKRRHHKRRLLTANLVRTLSQKLVQGGELFFQSDVFDLALDAMAALEGEPKLHNCAGEWSFSSENPYGARSLRESRCEEKGLHIWRLLYVKV